MSRPLSKGLFARDAMIVMGYVAARLNREKHKQAMQSALLTVRRRFPRTACSPTTVKRVLADLHGTKREVLSVATGASDEQHALLRALGIKGATFTLSVIERPAYRDARRAVSDAEVLRAYLAAPVRRLRNVMAALDPDAEIGESGLRKRLQRMDLPLS